MSSIKKYLESIRQYSFPKTRALEHGLDAVRKAHVAVSADLAKVRENLQLTHENHAQLLADQQQRVIQIESEHSNAHARVEHLERSIAEAGQRQESTEEHMASLEAKLAGERSNARERVASLERSIVADAEQRQKSTEEHVASLEAKLAEERSSAHARVASLKRSIAADAEQRQESTEEHMASLEAKLAGEHSSARERVASLERSIVADAEQRQKTTEKHVTSLEAKLAEESSRARVRVDSLKRSIAADAEQRQKSTEEHMVSLEAKLAGERSSARERVLSLERSIADAEQRQKSTEGHVASLQAKLEEERSRHEASTQATETFLARMQNEQQLLLKRIPELENNIQGVATRLQNSQQLESKKLQHSLLKFMIIFGVLFATGTLVGAFTMQALQDRKEELAVVKQNIHDTRVFMKQHLNNQDTVLNELTLSLNRKTASDLAQAEKKPLAHEAAMPEADIQPQKTVIFTPDISELQASLIVLGFDLGISKPNGELSIKTRQALQEFRQFYLPDSDAQDDVISEPLAALILKSADLARADAARFRIDSDVLAAIRLGSIRTGVDFSFLMEIARVESYFNPTVRAAKSSATGLFQFKDYAWLESIRTFGADYGLEDYATRVKLIDDEEHEQQPIVHNPLQLEVLALRLNPRLSTLMAAENIKRSLQILSASTPHAPVRTNLYLAHFLGPDAAVIFLKTLDEEPAIIARDIFPKEAELNPGVFQSRKHQPRTVAEVYRWLDNKFNIARYEEHNPG